MESARDKSGLASGSSEMEDEGSKDPEVISDSETEEPGQQVGENDIVNLSFHEFTPVINTPTF